MFYSKLSLSAGRAAAWLVAAWLAGLALTWGIVENPFYDYATFLHCAQRWAAGDVVYRDFQWMYPPLSLWIYGGLMRLIPDSYAAVRALSAILTGLLLLTQYRVARLLFRRGLALPVALAAFWALFAKSCSAGPNLFAFCFTFSGLIWFNTFVWLLGRLLLGRGGIGSALLAGMLAGLAVLNKHEQMAGVAAVLVFLLLRKAFLPRARRIPWLVLLAALTAVAGAGYLYCAQTSGWFYLRSALMAYGAAAEHAGRDLPSLLLIGMQLLLLFCCAGLFLWLVPARSPRARPLRVRLAGSGLLLLGAGGFALEGLRVYHLAKGLDWQTVRDVPASVAQLGMVSGQAGLLRATVNYLGEFIVRNIVPAFFCLLIAGVFLLVTDGSRKKRGRGISPRRQVLWLYLFACAGLQARGLLTYTDFGAFTFLFPILFMLLPQAALGLRRVLPFSRAALQRRLAGAALTLVVLLSLAVYAYEFRDARFRPLRVETARGAIDLPNIPENRAFARLATYLRTHPSQTVVCLPYEGSQYWLGGSTPFSWTAMLTPTIYHTPWRDGLLPGLEHRPATYIVFEWMDSAPLIFPSNVRDWFDGPHYHPYHWKAAFPELWRFVRTRTRKSAIFTDKGKTYFTLYVTRTKP